MTSKHLFNLAYYLIRKYEYDLKTWEPEDGYPQEPLNELFDILQMQEDWFYELSWDVAKYYIEKAHKCFDAKYYRTKEEIFHAQYKERVQFRWYLDDSPECDPNWLPF